MAQCQADTRPPLCLPARRAGPEQEPDADADADLVVSLEECCWLTFTPFITV